MRIVKTWNLEFGCEGNWEWTPRADQVILQQSGPAHTVDATAAVRAGLTQPLDFPPLSSALVQGDRVVLAIDRGLPQSAEIVSGIWPVLAESGIRPQDVLILQPGGWTSASQRLDPRNLLPETVRSAVRWEIHDPTIEGACGYLATTADGERIYLSHKILEADFVLPVTLAGFDPLQGTRSPMSVLYPGLSTPEAFAKTHGQGHRELRPEDDRPMRQRIEEIGWLLGVQFAVQLIPGGRRGTTGDVLAGGAEAVQRQVLKQLNEGWRVQWPARAETVIVTVPTVGESATWQDVGLAVDVARNVVEHGGKIVVLSDLQAPPGPGMEQLRGQASPRAALQPLREQAPPDLQAAAQWAAAADWARIYLLSRLDSDLVEELFAVPLRDVSEVERLLATTEDCALITTAQSTFAEIAEI